MSVGGVSVNRHYYIINPCVCVYLLWWFDMYRQDVESVVAEFTAPGALLTDPLEQTLLMGMSNRTSTAARAQQLPLQPIKTHNDKTDHWWLFYCVPLKMSWALRLWSHEQWCRWAVSSKWGEHLEWMKHYTHWQSFTEWMGNDSSVHSWIISETSSFGTVMSLKQSGTLLHTHIHKHKAPRGSTLAAGSEEH